MRIKLFLFSLVGSVEFFSLLLFHSVIFSSSSGKMPSPLAEKVYADSPLVPTSIPTFIPTPTSTPIPTNTPTPTLRPTNTPTSTPFPSSAPTKTLVTGPELEDLFTRFSNEYSVDREVLKKIARCESGFNTNAKNGPYGGMYQFSSSSWNSSRSLMGKDPNPDLRFNPEEGVRTAAFMISRNGLSMWPNCNK